MSTFITRDFLGIAVADLNSSHALFRRFQKVWPIDGEYCKGEWEYYENGWPGDNAESIQWWLDQSETRARFLNSVGITTEDLKEPDYKKHEIRRAYFKLTQPSVLNLDEKLFSYENMEEDFTYEEAFSYIDPENNAGGKFKVEIHYSGELNRYIDGDSFLNVSDVQDYDKPDSEPETVILRPMTNSEILTELLSHPKLYLLPANKRTSIRLHAERTTVNGLTYNDTINYGNADQYLTYYSPVADVKVQSSVIGYADENGAPRSNKYAYLALFDENSIEFDRKVDRIVQKSESSGFTAYLTYTFPVFGLTKDSPSLISFIDEFNARTAPTQSSASLFVMQSYVDYHDIHPVADVYAINPEDIDNPFPLWINGRLNMNTCQLIRRSDFRHIFGTAFSLDNDTQEASDWEKAAAVVIVIIAIVVGFFTYGIGTYGVLASASMAFGASATALTVGGALLAYYGGASANALVKFINNVGQIVGYVATVLGIMVIIQGISTALTRAATQKALEESAKSSAGAAATSISEETISQAIEVGVEYTTKQFVEAAFDMAKEAIVSYFTTMGTSGLSVAEKLVTWATDAFQVYTYYDQNYGEMAQIKEETDDLIEAEADRVALEELNEENAPSRLESMYGEVYQTSYGSYDAIEELNKKIQFGLGGNSQMMDPAAKIT